MTDRRSMLRRARFVVTAAAALAGPAVSAHAQGAREVTIVTGPIPGDTAANHPLTPPPSRRCR